MKIQAVKTPNLPENDVTGIIVSNAVPELSHALISRGIQLLHPQQSDVLQDATACHADMLCLYLGENKIAVAAGQESLASKLVQLDMQIVWIEQLDPTYPDDCRLNALILGNTIFTNKCSNNDLAAYAASDSLNIVEVKQGYARCSTCVVSENAIVTSDTSIERAAKAAGIDVLLVPPGEIKLEGYAYGFIGGACTKLSAAELAFTGKASALSYYDKLAQFCACHGVIITELTQLPLFDIGGMVQIREKSLF